MVVRETPGIRGPELFTCCDSSSSEIGYGEKYLADLLGEPTKGMSERTKF